MVLGRESAEWRRTSWLAASVVNMFRRSPIDPDAINPHLAECRARGLVDPPPPPAPFYLGDLDALATALRGDR